MNFGKTLHVTLVFVTLLVLTPCTACRQQEVIWQHDTLILQKGGADVRFFDLAKDQLLTVYFDIEPEDTEVVVLFGSVIRYGHGHWQWAYRYKEYSHIKDGSKIELEAPSSYYYGIWMKPRLDQTVKVTIWYWFSE